MSVAWLLFFVQLYSIRHHMNETTIGMSAWPSKRTVLNRNDDVGVGDEEDADYSDPLQRRRQLPKLQREYGKGEDEKDDAEWNDGGDDTDHSLLFFFFFILLLSSLLL